MSSYREFAYFSHVEYLMCCYQNCTIYRTSGQLLYTFLLTSSIPYSVTGTEPHLASQEISCLPPPLCVRKTTDSREVLQVNHDIALKTVKDSKSHAHKHRVRRDKDHLNLLHQSATDSTLKVKSEMDKVAERCADPLVLCIIDTRAAKISIYFIISIYIPLSPHKVELR